MNKTIAIKNLLFKQKIKLLIDNNFKKSNVPPDVEKYAKDLLTKEFFSQSRILTYISMSIIATIIIKNSDIQQTEQRILNGLICLFASIKLYQFYHGTENTAKTPLENEPIFEPEIVREGNPNVELILKVHKELPLLEDQTQFGIFNASKKYSLPPGTFFPYHGMIEILPLTDYCNQLEIDRSPLRSAVKICQFNKNNETYLVISNHEVRDNISYRSKLDFCNSSFTEEERKANKKLVDIGERNAIFTQIRTNHGIKGGILITEEVAPGKEILVPGNIMH